MTAMKRSEKMKLLLNDRNEIQAIGSHIEYGVWGNMDGLSSWKINENFYMMDGNFHIEDVAADSIPSYVTGNGNYIYKNGEFFLKDSIPNEYKERIAELENALCALTMQLQKGGNRKSSSSYDSM